MKKIILFIVLSIVSVTMRAQDCYSAEADHILRRANAAIGELKTSESYSKVIDEFNKLIMLIPECPDVYYKLFILYSRWAELDNNDTYRRLNNAELFLKVYICQNPNDADAKNQLAKLEIKREGMTGKYEDFLDKAYDYLKKGNNELAERYCQLHKSIDNRQGKREEYFKRAYLANSYFEKGEYEQAKELYLKMFAENPNDRYVQKRIIALHTANKFLFTSTEISDIRKTISELAPLTITKKGEIYQGNQKLSVEEARKIISTDPEALRMFNKSKGYCSYCDVIGGVGGVLILAGGFMSILALPAMNVDQPYRHTLAKIGIPTMSVGVIAIPIGILSRNISENSNSNKIRESFDIYNAHNKLSINKGCQFNIGMTSSGLGFALKF